MGRKRTRLNLSAEQFADLHQRLRASKDERERERVKFLILAARGECTVEELATATGRARATIQNWLQKFRAGGVSGLLERETPPGSISPIALPEVQAEFRAGVAAGRWRSAGEVAAWLKQEHGIRRASKSVYYWLAKNRSSDGHRAS